MNITFIKHVLKTAIETHLFRSTVTKVSNIMDITKKSPGPLLIAVLFREQTEFP